MLWIAKKDGADHDRHNEDDHLPNGFHHHLIGRPCVTGRWSKFYDVRANSKPPCNADKHGGIVEQKPCGDYPCYRSGKQPDNRP